MINENLLKVLQEQLNKEFYSAYLYLSMSAYFSDKGLLGFANWMRVQAQEESVHAKLLYDYLINRNERVVLTAIEAPPSHWESTLKVMEASLEHEIKVTESINTIVTIAEEFKDRPTITLMYWFVGEQVEEEASVKKVIDALNFIGEDKSAMFLLDQELAKRAFNPPSSPPSVATGN